MFSLCVFWYVVAIFVSYSISRSVCFVLYVSSFQIYHISFHSHVILSFQIPIINYTSFNEGHLYHFISVVISSFLLVLEVHLHEDGGKAEIPIRCDEILKANPTVNSKLSPKNYNASIPVLINIWHHFFTMYNSATQFSHFFYNCL